MSTTSKVDVFEAWQMLTFRVRLPWSWTRNILQDPCQREQCCQKDWEQSTPNPPYVQCCKSLPALHELSPDGKDQIVSYISVVRIAFVNQHCISGLDVGHSIAVSNIGNHLCSRQACLRESYWWCGSASCNKEAGLTYRTMHLWLVCGALTVDWYSMYPWVTFALRYFCNISQKYYMFIGML